jgi:hypothetical protein
MLRERRTVKKEAIGKPGRDLGTIGGRQKPGSETRTHTKTGSSEN